MVNILSKLLTSIIFCQISLICGQLTIAVSVPAGIIGRNIHFVTIEKNKRIFRRITIFVFLDLKTAFDSGTISR